jgi:hypothetical protein
MKRILIAIVALSSLLVSATPAAATSPRAAAPVAACGANQLLHSRFFDDMDSSASSANWTSDGAPIADSGDWRLDHSHPFSGDTGLFGEDSAMLGVHTLELARDIALPAGDGATPFLRFEHDYGFEQSFDGGVLEYSTNGGAAWADISGLPVDAGYNGMIDSASNPLDDHPAFVSESNGYRATRANLSSLAGKSVRFRWSIGTDNTGSAVGWFIDDVRIYSCLPDTDGDGVPNNADACPAVAGTNNGCPPATVGVGPTPAPVGGNGGGGTTLTLKSAKLRSCKISGKGKKLRVKCTLSDSGAVRRATVTIKKGKKTVLKKSLKPTSKGVLSIKPKRKLAKGSYKVSIVIRDASGAKRTLKKTLKVR